jgi:hypothetical protein
MCGVSLLNTHATELVTISTLTSLSSVYIETWLVESTKEMYSSRSFSVKLSNDPSI